MSSIGRHAGYEPATPGVAEHQPTHAGVVSKASEGVVTPTSLSHRFKQFFRPQLAKNTPPPSPSRHCVRNNAATRRASGSEGSSSPVPREDRYAAFSRRISESASSVIGPQPISVVSSCERHFDEDVDVKVIVDNTDRFAPVPPLSLSDSELDDEIDSSLRLMEIKLLNRELPGGMRPKTPPNDLSVDHAVDDEEVFPFIVSPEQLMRVPPETFGRRQAALCAFPCGTVVCTVCGSKQEEVKKLKYCDSLVTDSTMATIAPYTKDLFVRTPLASASIHADYRGVWKYSDIASKNGCLVKDSQAHWVVSDRSGFQTKFDQNTFHHFVTVERNSGSTWDYLKNPDGSVTDPADYARVQANGAHVTNTAQKVFYMRMLRGDYNPTNDLLRALCLASKVEYPLDTFHNIYRVAFRFVHSHPLREIKSKEDLHNLWSFLITCREIYTGDDLPSYQAQMMTNVKNSDDMFACVAHLTRCSRIYLSTKGVGPGCIPSCVYIRESLIGDVELRRSLQLLAFKTQAQMPGSISSLSARVLTSPPLCVTPLSVDGVSDAMPPLVGEEQTSFSCPYDLDEDAFKEDDQLESEYENPYNPFAGTYEFLGKKYNAVGNFVKESFSAVVDAVSALSVFRKAFQFGKSIVAHLRHHKETYKAILGLIAVFCCCLLVKKLVELGIDVFGFFQAVVTVLKALFSEIGEWISIAFGFFNFRSAVQDPVYTVDQKDGKFEFVPAPKTPKAEVDKGVVKAQSAQAVAALVAGYLVALSPSKKSGAERVGEAVKIIAPIVAVTGVSIQAVVYLFSKLPETYASYVRTWLSLDPIGVGCPALIHHMQNAVVQIKRVRDTPADKITYQNAAELVATYDAIQTLSVSSLVVQNSALNAAAGRLMTEMKQCVELARARTGNIDARITPMGLYFYGAPGIGKSTLMPLVARELFPEAPDSARMFTKSTSSEYWEGYVPGTPMVYFDDPHARSGPGVADFNASVIDYISSAMQILNMAFTEKGKIRFNARALAMSANVGPELPVQGLLCQAAFRRRFIYIEVILRDEYANADGTVDTTKLRAMTPQEKVNLTHLLFNVRKVTNLESGTSEISGTYCLAELCRLLKARLIEHEANFTSNMETILSELKPEVFGDPEARKRAVAATNQQLLDVNVVNKKNAPTGARYAEEKKPLAPQTRLNRNASSFVTKAQAEDDVKDGDLKPSVSIPPLYVGFDGLSIDIDIQADLGQAIKIKELEKIFDFPKDDKKGFLARLTNYLPCWIMRNRLFKRGNSVVVKMHEKNLVIAEMDDKYRHVRMGLRFEDGGRDLDFAKKLHVFSSDFKRGIVEAPWFVEALGLIISLDAVRGRVFPVGSSFGDISEDEKEQYANSYCKVFLSALGLTQKLKPVKPAGWINYVMGLFVKTQISEFTVQDDWLYSENALATAAKKTARYASEPLNEQWDAMRARMSREDGILCKGYEWLVYYVSTGRKLTVEATTTLVEATKSVGRVIADHTLLSATWRKHFAILTTATMFLSAVSYFVRPFIQKRRKEIEQRPWLTSEELTILRLTGKLPPADPEQQQRIRDALADVAKNPTEETKKHWLSPADIMSMLRRDRQAQSFEKGEKESIQEKRNPSRFQKEGVVVDYHNSQQYAMDWPEYTPGLPGAGGRMGPRNVAAQAKMELPNSIRTNMVRLALLTPEGEEIRHMYGLGIKGGVALFPAHFFRVIGRDGQEHSIVQDCKMAFQRNETKKTLAFDHKRVVWWKDEDGLRDLCAYDFGMLVECFRDITNHLTGGAQQDFATNVPSMFCKMGEEDRDDIAQMDMERCYYQGQNSDDLSCEETYVFKFWEHRFGKPGDCGAILYAPGLGLLGMHTAAQFNNKGSLHRGIAARIDKETVMAFLRGTERIIACSGPVHNLVEVADDKCERIGDSEMVGILSETPFSPTSCDFVRLPYQEEEWANTKYLPAVLGPNHPVAPGHSVRDISAKSYAKLCRKVDHFAQSDVDQAMGDIIDLFMTRKPFRPPQKLSEEEIINGGLPHLEGLDLKTSAGYRYNLLKPPGAKGKKHLFSSEKPRVVMNAVLREELDKAREYFKRGIAWSWIADYNLKSELRSEERVLVPPGEIPASRGINASPVDETMIFREYFGDFLNFMYTNHTWFEMCIGINPFSIDWELALKKLKRTAPTGFATDYSGHETNSTSQMMEAFWQVVETFYKQNPNYENEDGEVRHRLMYALCYHVVRLGPRLFFKSEHLLTGSALTSVLNSFVTMMHFRIAFLDLSRKQGSAFSTMFHFRKLVSLLVYGDDNVAAVSQRISPWFNARTIVDFMKPYGVVMTMADKHAAITADCVPVEELSFLKCTTVHARNVSGQTLYPYVEEDSIIKSLMWCGSKTLTPIEAVYILGNDALRRVWPSGVQRFNIWRERIRKVWTRIGIEESPINWAEVQRQWINDDMPEWAMFTNDAHAQSASMCYRPIVRAQMMQSGEMALPITEETKETIQVTAMVGGSGPTKHVPMESGNSIQKNLKRYYPIHFVTAGTTDFAFSLANIFTGVGFNVNSIFKFYASMFTGFMGDFIFQVYSDVPTDLLSIGFSADTYIQKRKIINASTLMQTGPTSFQRGFIQFKCPMLTPYRWALIAPTDSDTTNPFCQFGNVAIFGMTGNCVIYACLADEARFFGLRQIPRLLVQGANYPHEGGGAVNVPEFYEVGYSTGAPQFTPPNQAWCDQFDGSRVVYPNAAVGPLDAFVCPSSFFSNDQLRVLFQVAIQPSQPRNVQVGVTTVKYLNFQQCFAVPQSVTLSGSLGQVPIPVYNVEYATMSSQVTYNIDGMPVNIGTTAVIRDYSSVSAKKILGVPQSAFYFKSGWNDSKQVVTGPLETTPENHYVVSLEPRWGLRPVPLEEKKDVDFIEVKIEKPERRVKAQSATQFANEVLLHCAGDLPDGAINAAAGGLIPESTTKLPERQAFLESVVWDTTHQPGTILASYEAPFDMVNDLSSAPAFKASVFWTGTPELGIKLTPNPFMTGQLAVCWAPCMNKATASAMYGGRVASALVTHNMTLQPTTSDMAALSAPFMYPKYAVKTSDKTEVLGTFLVIVLNRLRIGEQSTSSSVTVTTFGSFKNNKFSVLNPRVMAQGGFSSKSINYNFSHIAQASVDASGTRDEFKGGNTDVSANDRAFTNLNGYPTRNTGYPDLASCSNIDQGTMLALEPASLPKPSVEDTASLDDEMSLDALLRRDSYMGWFSIQSSALPGELVYTCDLCPCSEWFSLLQGASADVSLLSYVSILNEYWQGDIVFTFEFLATSSHALDVMICSAYGVDGSDVSMLEATSQYVTYVHVTGPRTRVSVRFPWTSDTPLKRIPNGTYANGIGFSPGAMYVRVVAPMQSNPLVTPTIDCNVFMRLEGKTFNLGNSGVDVVNADIPVLIDGQLEMSPSMMVVPALAPST